MKNRFLAMALVSAMCAGLLTGCSTDAPTADGAQAADGAYNIGVIVKLTDSHFQKVMAGAQAYADEHGNVSLEFMSPTSATAYDEQMNMMETALNNANLDALIISPQQSATAATLVDSAASDKKIVALDTDFTSDRKATFVGTGNKDAAIDGAQAAYEMAKANGIDKPTAVILAGTQGDETHDARLNGYKEGFEAAGGELIEIQYCDALADRAATAMEAVMQKYPDGVDVVLSTNDDMAMSAAKVIGDWKLDTYANTIVCGFDGNQSALEGVQSGVIGIDIVQQGYEMGYMAVEAAIKLLEGGTVDSFIDSGVEIVDASSIEACINDFKSKGLWEE